MTKQQSIDRVSTVTLDRTSHEYPKTSMRAYKHADGVSGKAPSKRVVTVERGEVEITIDIEALTAWMAHRAMATKSGASNMQDGLVVARVIKRETLSKVTEDIPAYAGTEWI